MRDALLAAIKLGRGGGGDQCVAAIGGVGSQLEYVAAHYTPGRVDDIDVANVAFGIERPLHDEGPFVRATREDSATASDVRT